VSSTNENYSSKNEQAQQSPDEGFPRGIFDCPKKTFERRPAKTKQSFSPIVKNVEHLTCTCKDFFDQNYIFYGIILL